jgi:hypothetical protein
MKGPRDGADSRQWPRQLPVRGYTVAELLVALALTSLIVLASMQLIFAAVTIVDRGSWRLPSPRLESVVTSLRNDVHRSVAIVDTVLGWQNGPLDLACWDGARVRYLLDGDRLVRESSDSLGDPAVRRVLTSGISSWWWRLLNSDTVEIRLVAAPARRSEGPAGGGRSLTRRFSVRGWPDGRSW